MMHNAKSLISVCEKFSASINKISIFSGRLDTRLSLNEVYRLSRLATREATRKYHVYK